MRNYILNPPFILLFDKEERGFTEINVSSFEFVYKYDERCAKQCVVHSDNYIQYMSDGSELLIFNIDALNDIENISDIDQILKLVSVKNVDTEALTDVYHNSSYTTYITCNYMNIHDYYNELFKLYDLFLYEQVMFGEYLNIHNSIISRVNKLVKRKMESMNNTTINIVHKFQPRIKKVIFAKPHTIVIWNDNSKTIATCANDTEFSKEIGFAIAIAKKHLGSWTNFQNYIDAAIISGTKEDHVAAKERRKEKCLQKNNQ